jgi:transposase
MYLGIDTHKRSHVLVALDEHGRSVGTRSIANTTEGWVMALQWAQEAATERSWGIENSGSWGKGFAQFLLAHGETEVREVRPQRTAQYRRRGRRQDKTDHTDALAIARVLLAEGEELPLVPRDDASTEVRVLSDHRDNLVVERTRLINQLHAQMLQLDPEYKAKSGPLAAVRGMQYCQDLTLPGASPLVQTRLLVVHHLADQLVRLEEAIGTVTAELSARVRATGTPLLSLHGVGEITAARLIGEVGVVPRLGSAAALAAFSGTAPVALSSGGRGGHRLNRGGNRRLNSAIHIIALGQRRADPRAQAYYEKKRAEGKTGREAMRCLKRRLVDVLYRTMCQTGQEHGVQAA